MAPRSSNEDDSRHEFILNIILVGSIVATLILDSSLVVSRIILGDGYRGINIFLFSSIVLIFIALLYISRKGYFYIASYILLALYFISTTYTISRWGVELPLAAFGYVITIIISSILINTRFALFVTLLVVITLVTFGFMQVQGINPVELYWKQEFITIKDPLQLASVLIVIMTVSWLSNREIERSLARARRSEQELKKERDLLEIKVEERTTELKQMQAEKITQLYRFAEFGRLSSGLFHDLMNPLNAVIAHVSRLEENTGDLPSVQSHLVKAVASSKRMGELLGSIKKQIRTDTEVQVFFPFKEIEEAVDILGYRAREAQVLLKIKGREDIKLFGNPLRFHQVAVNLIANAIDACMHSRPLHPTVLITIQKKDKDLLLTVSDNGSGIPDEILSKIFDPFFTTKQIEGMGLGLSTTKGIVEKDFGGSIEVQSDGKSGSTFIVSVPLKKNE